MSKKDQTLKILSRLEKGEISPNQAQKNQQHKPPEQGRPKVFFSPSQTEDYGREDKPVIESQAKGNKAVQRNVQKETLQVGQDPLSGFNS